MVRYDRRTKKRIGGVLVNGDMRMDSRRHGRLKRLEALRGGFCSATHGGSKKGCVDALLVRCQKYLGGLGNDCCEAKLDLISRVSVRSVVDGLSTPTPTPLSPLRSQGRRFAPSQSLETLGASLEYGARFLSRSRTRYLSILSVFIFGGAVANIGIQLPSATEGDQPSTPVPQNRSMFFLNPK